MRIGSGREGVPVATGTPGVSRTVADPTPAGQQEAAQLRCTGLFPAIGAGPRSAETVILEGPERLHLTWPFAPLLSGESVRVDVRGLTQRGWSGWASLSVSAGLPSEDFWTAQWISPDGISGINEPAPQYPWMRAWVEHVRRLVGDGVRDQGFQYGDWLDPGVVATAYYARSAGILADAADALGLGEDAQAYRRVSERAAEAFREAYVHPDGSIRSDCPTVYALAIAFDLVTGTDRERAGRRLRQLVTESGFVIETGFLGTPFLLDALVATGGLTEAYRLLLQEDPPSWLYAVRIGATTIWERWDSMLPDGSIHPGTMTSFNHYAYGAVADWMHRTICGLEVIEPGFRRFRVAPKPGGGIRRSSLRFAGPYGTISIDWRISQDDLLTVEVGVPHGSEAEVLLPGLPAETVASGMHAFTSCAAQPGAPRDRSLGAPV